MRDRYLKTIRLHNLRRSVWFVGSVGFVVLGIGFLKAEQSVRKPLASNICATKQANDLFERIRLYLSGTGVDAVQEHAFAEELSQALRSGARVPKELKTQQQALRREVMFWALQMRLNMIKFYPEMKEMVRHYGSVGVALFFKASMDQKKPVSKVMSARDRRAAILKAVDVMIREAWFFSRPARDFLFLLAAEDVPSLEAGDRDIKKRIFDFYTQASALGRSEEAYRLLRLKCRLVTSEPERLKLWNRLSERHAYRVLLHESLRNNHFKNLAVYWQKFLVRERYKNMQKRPFKHTQVQRVS